MTKLPETDRKPFYFCNKCGFMGDEGPLHIQAGNIIQCSYLAVCDNHIYTPEQMLQFRRDALEEAAKCCEWLANAVSNSNDVAIQNRHLCATEIRKLKDET